MRMSFIGQVCLHIRGICYSDRSSTVQQHDSDRDKPQIIKNNIQIGNVQKSKKHYIYIYYIYIYIMCVTGPNMCKFMKISIMCGE